MNQPVYTVPAVHAFDIASDELPLSIHNNIDEQTTLNFDAFKTDNSFYTPLALFSYDDRVKVSFALTPTYAKYFALIKGLLEFNRSKNYNINYNRVDKSFDVSVDITLLENVQQFLKKVTVWLDRELKFKQNLKSIIQFETEYKKRAARVYQLQSEQLF